MMGMNMLNMTSVRGCSTTREDRMSRIRMPLAYLFL